MLTSPRSAAQAHISPDSPIGHVQKEGAAGRVKLKPKQPLKLRNEDVLVRGAHAAELLHKLRVHVHVRALHGWRVSRGGDGEVVRGVLSQFSPRPSPAITTSSTTTTITAHVKTGGRRVTL